MDSETASTNKLPSAPCNFSGPEWAMLAVLVGQLLCLPFTDFPGPPGVFSLTFIGCSLALPAMLTVWCSVRGGLWRYLVFLAISLTNGILLTLFANGRIDLLLIGLPLATAVPVLLTLSTTKKFFGMFSRSDSENEVFDEGLQFKISHLFIATTALAIFIVIGKAIAPFVSTHLDHDAIRVLGWICIVIASNTILSVWALLGRRAVFRPIVTVVLGVTLIFVSCKVAYETRDAIIWYVINGIPFAAALGLMSLFRRDGWRFRKK